MQIFARTLKAPRGVAASAGLDRARLESHLSISRYGAFELSDAIRPSFELAVVPEEGYRRDVYLDAESNASAPVLVAAASREKIFDLFFDALDELGPLVDVIVESSHRQGEEPRRYVREGIDLPVLKSVLTEYERSLVDDGCFGIAVSTNDSPFEVQLDEHKLLSACGADLRGVERRFRRFGLTAKPEMRFLPEAEHIHASRRSFVRAFDALRRDLGAEN